jgi:tetratricopeptide (TPR) repeat protein
MRLRIALMVSLAFTVYAVSAQSPEPRAPGQVASSQQSKDWTRMRSEHFVAMGNGSEKSLKTTVTELERFRDTIQLMFPESSLRPDTPTALVQFKQPLSMTRFRPLDERGNPRANVAGYFEHYPDISYMVVGMQFDQRDMLNVVFHEYAHYLFHRSRTRIPTWIDEGLAEFYSTFRLNRDGVGIIGTVPPWRGETLRRENAFISFDELMTDAGAARVQRDPILTSRFYAHAWLLVHYSIVGKRAGQLQAYLQALDRHLTPQEAFREAYRGVSFPHLSEELRFYGRMAKIPAIGVRYSTAARPATLLAEPMLDSDALALQGDLLARLGADDDAEPLLTRALQIDPAHVNARVSMAAVERWRDRLPSSTAALREIADAAPNHFGVSVALAEDLLLEKRFGEALPVADRAAQLNPQSPDAWIFSSIAAEGLGLTSRADAAFARARALDGDSGRLFERAQRFCGVGLDGACARCGSLSCRNGVERRQRAVRGVCGIARQVAIETGG